MAINQDINKISDNARTSHAAQSALVTALPPLENGDSLLRSEFERRYEAMPWLRKAELIEGVAYMGSPVRFETHAEPRILLITWIGLYCSVTAGVRAGENATVRLDIDNEPQARYSAAARSRQGRASRIGSDGYVEGPPELVIEIAATEPSTQSSQ